MKVSRRSQKDFEFFSATELQSIGASVGGGTPLNSEGFTALECWHAKDTHGKTLPCREPEKLDAALRGKASWNLQVKQWAEDIADGLLLTKDELRGYCAGLPEWIYAATMRQAASICLRDVGFVPSFAR